MKHAHLYTVGIMLLGLEMFGASPAKAATAAGPYYAPPAWDQTLPSDTRFIVLSNFRGEEPGPGGTTILTAGLAVLDRETGLVWETSPSFGRLDWISAQIHCNTLNLGNRMGWRLPMIEELASLVDASVASPGPTLPSGHPFSNVQSADHWSASAFADFTGGASQADFSDGVVTNVVAKSVRSFVWCVRGGQGVDTQ